MEKATEVEDSGWNQGKTRVNGCQNLLPCQFVFPLILDLRGFKTKYWVGVLSTGAVTKPASFCYESGSVTTGRLLAAIVLIM